MATGVIREITHTFGGSNTDQITYQKVDGSTATVSVVWGGTTVQGQIYTIQDHFFGTNQTCERLNEFHAGLSAIRDIILPQTETGVERKFHFDYNSDSIDTVNLQWQPSCQTQFQPITSSSHGWGSLKHIDMPNGAKVDYAYSLDGNHQLQGETNEIPRERISAKTVTHDGMSDSWTYLIEGGGGTVTGPDGSLTGEYGYNTDPAHGQIYGGANGLGGMVYKSARYLNGQPQITTERHWTRLLFDNAYDIQPGSAQKSVFNPVVDAEYTTLHDANGTALKMSAKTYLHDYNGNVTEERDYDWFDPNLVIRDANNANLPTGVPASATLLRVTTTSYHSQADGPASTNVYAKRDISSITPFILNAPKESTVGPNSTTTLAKTQFHYDNQGFNTLPTIGNVTTERRDKDGTWIDVTHTYDAFGNRASTTDPKGNVTTLAYGDATHAQPTSVTVDPNNQITGDELTTYTEYDYYTGLVKSQTDANGNQTTTDYTNQLLGSKDPFGRPGFVLGPYVTVTVGGSTSLQRHKVVTKYFDNARQVEVLSDLNTEGDGKLRSRTTADQIGRAVLAESSEDGSTYAISAETVYKYKPGGQNGVAVFTRNPHRSASGETTDGWTRTTQDALGRTTEVATFSGSTIPADTGCSGACTGAVTTSHTQTTYLASETTVTDQAGKARRSITDGLGRLIRVDEPTTSGLGSSSAPNQPTSYTYDALGNLLQVQQSSQQRIFTYDSLSRLKTAKNPEQVNSSSQMVATSYDYDDASNLTLRTNPNATTVGFTYDGLNRAKTKTLSVGGTWTYAYDTGTNGKGKLVSVTQTGGDGYYYDGYDAMGRVTASRQKTTTTQGGQQSYSLTYGYDLAGNMTKEVYPSGKEYRTDYDSAGRVSQVSRYISSVFDKTYASGFSYTAHGAASSMSLAGGAMSEQNVYNSRLQPTSMETRKVSTNELLLGLDFTYGTTATTNNGNMQSQTIRIGGTTAPSFAINQSFTYDELNRLQTATETAGWSQTYSYDRFGNRWVSVSTGYIPDANLCPTQSSHISASTNRILLSGFSYDNSGNQKTQTRNSQTENYDYDSENRLLKINSGSIGDYSYDGDGRRVKKIDSSGTTVFVYNAGGQLIAEYHSDTVPPATGAGGTSYLTTDHLGSTRLVTSASGGMKARYDYLPFGEELPSTLGARISVAGYGLSDGTRQKFTQKERDSESGLDYFLARYYSSAQGRFTSVDMADAELRYPQDWNRYAYTLNNPLRYTDPDGQKWAVQYSVGQVTFKWYEGDTIPTGEGWEGTWREYTAGWYIGANEAIRLDPHGPREAFRLSRDLFSQEDWAKLQSADPAHFTHEQREILFSAASSIVNELPHGQRRAIGDSVTTAIAIVGLSAELSIQRSTIGPKSQVPPTPGGMTQKQFGEQVMKWGQSGAEARARIASLTREELERAGVTKAIAKAWRNFYRNEASSGRMNPSAAGRAELMSRAVKLLKGE